MRLDWRAYAREPVDVESLNFYFTREAIDLHDRRYGFNPGIEVYMRLALSRDGFFRPRVVFKE